METILNVGGDLPDRLVRLPPQGLQVSLQRLPAGEGFHIPDLLQVIQDDPPGPAQETEGTVDPLVAPLEILFRRGGEETEDPRRVGPVGLDQIVRIHDVLERLGHLLRLADLDLPAALRAFSLFDLIREEVAVFRAAHRLLADHPLREEVREGFVYAEESEIPKHLRIEPRVEEVEDRMFDAADVLIHRHPVIQLLPVEARLHVVAGRTEAVEVPGGLDEGVHRVRLAPGRFPAAGACRLDEGLVPGERRAPLAGEFHVPGEDDGEVFLRNGNRPARLAEDHRDGGAPIALAGDPPVAQAVLDRFLSPAERR